MLAARAARRLRVLLLSAVFGTACGDGLGPLNQVAQPVIIVLLTAGESQHRLTAFWSLPTDSVDASLFGRAILPADLDLVVRGPAGVQVVPRLGSSPGLYLLDLPVMTGGTYELVGQVAGKPVSGRCTIPGDIEILEPADGIFRATPSNQDGIPYKLRSDGGTFVFFKADTGISGSPFDLEGVFHPFPFAGGATRVYIETYEPAASAFFARRYWLTNLTGAVGVFGGRARRPATIVVQ